MTKEEELTRLQVTNRQDHPTVELPRRPCLLIFGVAEVVPLPNTEEAEGAGIVSVIIHDYTN